MNKNHQNAAQQLHKFLSGDSDLSDAEIRNSLKSEGVDVDNFLARLAKDAAIPAELPAVKQPSASEKLRALANRAGNGVKKLLGDTTLPEFGGASAVFGRSGKPKSKRTRQNTKRKK
jgi:hypothetical protein